MKKMNIEDNSPQAMPEINERMLEWINSFNNKSEDMNLLYTKNALLFPGQEGVLQGTDIIHRFYNQMSDSDLITDLTIDYRVKPSENPDKIYETGHLHMETGECFQYLIVWTFSEGQWLHEVDAIAKREINLDGDLRIPSAREQWVKLANAHNAFTLATKLYTDKYVYLNRGRTYTGYTSLAEAYSYMNQSDFKVNLAPDISIMVQPDLAYEIGTWTSYGTGHYIILWELRNGEWKIRFDTNW